VTGGAGFIGSNLVDALLDRGDDVAVLDDFSTGREGNLRDALAAGAAVHRADVRNALEVDDVLATVKPAVVFHLAAQIDVRRSVAEPAFDARTNVEGTINVLEAARRHGVARVINVSTGGAIYGDTDIIPTPETVEPLPEAPYGQSKYCAERYLGLYQRRFGLTTATIRLGNVYGPRQDPLGEAGVIAIFCGRLMDGGRPRIYGETDVIPTPETVEPLPEAPYGQSKYCAERYLGLYKRLFGLTTATIRLGNVYGPRQDPLGEAGVIAIFCGRLERGERPTVYGSGEQTRDYVYVGDVVGALLTVLEHPEAHGEYNVGTGRESSVLDIVAGLRDYADGDFEPEFADARPGELDRSCLDVTRAREELGWSAQVELGEGLRRTMEWARSASVG
jgi:nucleoside-diphosphate-sugar epimerase